MKTEVRDDVVFLSPRYWAWVARFLAWWTAALKNVLSAMLSALVWVVVRVALLAALILAPQALAAGQTETEPQVAQVAAAPPSVQTDTPVEPALRVAQAPSGGGAATKDDIRWQDERNERRWDKMLADLKEERAERRADMKALRADMNALRADLSSFKSQVITLLAGLLLAIVGIPWGPRLSRLSHFLWSGRTGRDNSHGESHGASTAAVALLAVALLSGGVSSVHARGPSVDRASDAQLDRFILCNQALTENVRELARFVDSFRRSLRRGPEITAIAPSPPTRAMWSPRSFPLPSARYARNSGFRPAAGLSMRGSARTL